MNKRHRPNPSIPNTAPAPTLPRPSSPAVSADISLGSVLCVLVQNDFLDVASVGTLACISSYMQQHIDKDDVVWAHLCRTRWPSTVEMPASMLGDRDYRWLYRERDALVPRRVKGGETNGEQNDDGPRRLAPLPPPKLALSDLALFIDATNAKGMALASEVLTGDALIPLLETGRLRFDLARQIIYDMRLADDGTWECPETLKGVNFSVHLCRISDGTWLRLHEKTGINAYVHEPLCCDYADYFFSSHDGNGDDSQVERETPVPSIRGIIESEYRVSASDTLEELMKDCIRCTHFKLSLEFDSPWVKNNLPLSARYFGFKHVRAKYMAALQDSGGGDSNSETRFESYSKEYWRDGRSKDELGTFFDQAERVAKAHSQHPSMEVFLEYFRDERDTSSPLHEFEPFEPKEESQNHNVTVLHIFETLLDQAKRGGSLPILVEAPEVEGTVALESVLCILAQNGFLGPADLGHLACTSDAMRQHAIDDKLWAHLCRKRWPSTAMTPPALLGGRGHHWLYQQRSSKGGLHMKGKRKDLPPPTLTGDDIAIFIDMRDAEGRELMSEVLTGDALAQLLEKGTMPLLLKRPFPLVHLHVNAGWSKADHDINCTVHLLHIGKKKWLRLHETTRAWSDYRASDTLYSTVRCGLERDHPGTPLDDLLAILFESGEVPDENRSALVEWWQDTDYNIAVSDSLEKLRENQMQEYDSYHFRLWQVKALHANEQKELNKVYLSLFMATGDWGWDKIPFMGREEERRSGVSLLHIIEAMFS